MRLNWFLALCLLSILQTGSCRPRNKSQLLAGEPKSEVKKREIIKSDIDLLKELEKSGVGVKRNSKNNETPQESKISIIESAKSLSASKSSSFSKTDEDLKSTDLSEVESATRVKKQTPNNLCIKAAGGGKTVCGSMVSARGPIVEDMRAIMQGMKPASAMGDLHSSMVNEMNNVPSKLNQYSPVQGRTIDLMNLSPVSQGYGSPLVYSAPTPPSADSNALAYGHSFFKPPPVTPIPVTLVPQHQPHSIIHPWLVPHLLPHIMPHLMPNLMPSWMPHLSSYVPPHRIETYNYLEPPKNDVKQPPPSIPHYSYVSPDSALICQPVRNQRFDNSFDYIYKPDAAADKSFNVSESGSKNQESSEDERKIKDNLRKVNEIKDEITKLNRAAQRIVDQQERLTEMHQKQLWGGSSSVSTMQGANHMPHPYMGTGYFAHPTMPWGYSRSNILSYPNSHDDIDFFMNLLNAGKKIGIVSNSLQPNTAVSESEKGSQQPDKNKKEQTENADSKQEALKTNSNERKRK